MELGCVFSGVAVDTAGIEQFSGCSRIVAGSGLPAALPCSFLALCLLVQICVISILYPSRLIALLI
jgi:hypothetical protein